MKLDPKKLQIVLVDDEMPADQEYGTYRGYVLEYEGCYLEDSKKETLDAARRLAAELTGTDDMDWRRYWQNDGRGVQVWDIEERAWLSE